MQQLTLNDIRRLLPPRKPDSHKGDYGHALIIGGNMGMAGAVIIALRAALRSGAGLLTAAVPDAVVPVIQAVVPSSMAVSIDDWGNAADALAPYLERCTCFAIGPGMGAAEIGGLLTALQDTGKPLVIDADALNYLSGLKGLSGHMELLRPSGNTILTPHIGEFKRLIGSDASYIVNPAADGAAFAKKYGVNVVVKGRESYICTPDGHITHNVTGNPGMAKGGSGDLLTGMMAAFLAQKLTAYDAARLACFVAGLAADSAKQQLGEKSMTADDVIEHISTVLIRN